MSKSSLGLASCPFCGGSLIHSGLLEPRVCSTCAICLSCCLLLTQAKVGRPDCFSCGFRMLVAVPFGSGESDVADCLTGGGKNKIVHKALVSLKRFFSGRSYARVLFGLDGRPRRRPSSRPSKSPA